MCWRLLYVTEKSATIEKIRGFSILPAENISIPNADLACYEICHGFCACEIISEDRPELAAEVLQQMEKKLKRKGLKQSVIDKRLAEKKRSLSHKLFAQNGLESAAQRLEAWLKRQGQAVYLLRYWQERNAKATLFELPKIAISQFAQLPENIWVVYQPSESGDFTEIYKNKR